MYGLLILYFLYLSDPSIWGDSYANCGGSSQSPIDIDTQDADYDSNLTDLVFTGYTTWQNNANAATIENNGHSSE